MAPVERTHSKSGFIEIVNGESVYGIWDRNFAFYWDWQPKFNKAATFEPSGASLAKLCASSVGTFVSIFVLGIGDRHMDNIFLSNDGCILNIDFGYAFGERTIFVDAHDFPLPNFLVNVFTQEEVWDDFKDVCFNAIQSLCDYKDTLLQLAKCFPFSNTYQKKQLETFERTLGISRAEFEAKIESGYLKKLAKDFVHFASKNMKK